jgi:hypothetical protein
MIRKIAVKKLTAGLFYCAMISAAALTGCATYQDQVGESRRMMSQGNVNQALSKFGELAAKDDGDKLVHLLDYGVALEIANQIPESNKVLLQADKLSDELDYHSVSRVAGSLLTSEEMIQYKGDTFEKIFINAYLAMNYLELGKFDDALVECRRINDKYLKLRGEEKKNFELNPFAKYLSAVVWEATGQYDDAYIAYSEAYKLSPYISTIREDLIRSSKRARRMDDYDKWKKEFPEVQEKPEWYDRTFGELVVIYQQGWGPRKAPDPASPRFPILRPTYNATQKARVEVAGKPYESRFVYSVEEAAIRTLMEDRGALLARRMGGIVAKEVAADQLRRKNELLGFAAWVFFHASDRADVRQWSLLPQSIQLIRVPLKPGKYKFAVQGLGYDGSLTGESSEEREVEIKAGRKVFVNWRSLK